MRPARNCALTSPGPVTATRTGPPATQPRPLAMKEAIRATSGLEVAATQTSKVPRSSTAERLRAQVEGRHYSTWALNRPQELRASIATFLARLSPEVCWVDEHLLVVAHGEPPNQGEPDGLARRARQAIKGSGHPDHAARR
jgi:hypothetical protein